MLSFPSQESNESAQQSNHAAVCGETQKPITREVCEKYPGAFGFPRTGVCPACPKVQEAMAFNAALDQSQKDQEAGI